MIFMAYLRLIPYEEEMSVRLYDILKQDSQRMLIAPRTVQKNYRVLGENYFVL